MLRIMIKVRTITTPQRISFGCRLTVRARVPLPSHMSRRSFRRLRTEAVIRNLPPFEPLDTEEPLECALLMPEDQPIHYGRGHTYMLKMEYDGTKYCGWQLQPGKDTIQGRLEKALVQFTGCDRKVLGVVGAGRTDSGVHALGQVVHFYTREPVNERKLYSACNGILPFDIRVKEAKEVYRGFHARFHATNKTYHYYIHTDPLLDPFTRLYRKHIWTHLDVEAMREAAKQFVGTHDFSSFKNKNRDGTWRDPVRTITHFKVVDIDRGVRVEVESSGFLYKQVRNMVGALIRIGRGKHPVGHIDYLLKAKDRALAPPGAAAEGLFLVNVEYPPELLNKELPLGYEFEGDENYHDC